MFRSSLRSSFRPAVLSGALVLVVSGVVVSATSAAPTASAPATVQSGGAECRAARQGGVLRLRRNAPGPGRQVRQAGPDADHALLPPARSARQRQRPAHPGAAQHGRRVVLAGHRCLARRPRLDQQHVPQERRPVREPDGCLRPRRAASRVDRPGRREGRPQGRPGGVGRRPQRLDPGTDDRLPELLLRPRRGHQLHRRARRRALRRPGLHLGVRAAVRPPGRLRQPGAVPWRRPGSGDGLDQRP